jgi:hypothetical protein
VGVSDEDLFVLGRLKNLRELNLGDNSLSDSSLTIVGTMTNLVDLDLSDNPRICDSGVSPLNNLTILRSLNLWGSGITPGALSALTNLSRLELLKLDWGGERENSVVDLSALAGLKAIDVRNRVPWEICRDPARLPASLEQVRVPWREGDPPLPQWMTRLPNVILADPVVACEGDPAQVFTDLATLGQSGPVRWLTLSAYPLGDMVTGCGAALEYWESAEVRGRTLDRVLATMRELPELEVLKIQYATITDDGLKPLIGLPRLRRLELVWTRGYTAQGLRTLLQESPNLQTVVLRR